MTDLGRPAAVRRRRSGSTPCGRNQRKSTISSPIATHCRSSTRPGFPGMLGMYLVASSKATGTRIAPSTAPRWLPAPPMITAANSTMVSA